MLPREVSLGTTVKRRGLGVELSKKFWISSASSLSGLFTNFLLGVFSVVVVLGLLGLREEGRNRPGVWNSSASSLSG